MLVIRAAAAGLAVAVCAPGVFAQARTLQFDLNTAYYQAYNTGGTPVPFGGTTHTGSVKFDMHSDTELLGVLIRTGGPGNPFINQASYTGTLSALAVTILLSNGNVTGGSIEIDINGGISGGGDQYFCSIDPGGSVQDSVVPVPGSFTIDSLTSHGRFSDANFSGVNVSDFFGAQGVGNLLTGSFLAFKMTPNAFGKGPGDLDIFVNNVPGPSSLALLGLGGLVATRRRR